MSSVSNASLVDDSQTVALWHFDSQSAGVTPDDDVANPGRNNDLVLNVFGSGATITTGNSGVMGEAINLGTSDCRALGAWEGYDSFKIELAFKQEIDASRPVQQILQLPGALSIWISSNWQLYAQVIDGSWNTVASLYALTIPDGDRPVWANGQWTSMVVEYSNRVLSMTVNSKTITANAATGLEMGHFNGDIYLGDPYSGGANAFSGLIDEVKISVVPEPITAMLLSLGFGGIIMRKRKK